MFKWSCTLLKIQKYKLAIVCCSVDYVIYEGLFPETSLIDGSQTRSLKELMTNPGQLETGYYAVLRNAAIASLVLAGFSSGIEKRKVIKEEYRVSVERNV